MDRSIFATEKVSEDEPPVGIVFTDVDGTLLDAEHRVIPEACPVVQRVVEAGIPFVLVSARMPEGLTTIQREMGFTGPLVCYSGAYVLDEDGRELLSRPIGLADALELKAFLDTDLPEICCSEYGFHTWACDDDSDPRIKNEERITTLKAMRAPLTEAFDEQGVHKFLLMGEPEQIEAAELRVADEFPQLEVVRSSPILCEIMNGAASKAEGVQVVCEHFGLVPADAVAFGDGRNDIAMLDAVPRSYAMGNAPDEVKRAAARVCPWTNDENGLARMLEELLRGC
ncbi:Cof-type HAD-IIB family hydrolase [Enorma phocaeensis]|uniref:Cof-type HAD-IIB family hydrolase n=1 Tax=Enorma phocaeensis TaxID=1871019 RepID=UPI002353FBF5|nr:Cof-type HAD-IIB family hydrolase [Enorma phocaeensis]